jgi:hypothetical protein
VAKVTTGQVGYIGVADVSRTEVGPAHIVRGDTELTWCDLPTGEFQALEGYVNFGMACERCKRAIAGVPG